MTPKPKIPTRPPTTLTAEPGDVVAVDQALWRIHPVKGPHPLAWNRLRTFGPLLTARFDPHPPDEAAADRPRFGVAYAGLDTTTCAAEVFQATRTVALSDDYNLTGWIPARPLRLLDLTGTWALRNGGANAFTAAPRPTCRAWSHAIRTTWPDLDGLLSRSTMTGQRMVTLYQQAEDSFPPNPAFQRPLDHPKVAALMRCAASLCGYDTA